MSGQVTPPYARKGYHPQGRSPNTVTLTLSPHRVPLVTILRGSQQLLGHWEILKGWIQHKTVVSQTEVTNIYSPFYAHFWYQVQACTDNSFILISFALVFDVHFAFCGPLPAHWVDCQALCGSCGKRKSHSQQALRGQVLLVKCDRELSSANRSSHSVMLYLHLSFKDFWGCQGLLCTAWRNVWLPLHLVQCILPTVSPVHLLHALMFGLVPVEDD